MKELKAASQAAEELDEGDHAFHRLAIDVRSRSAVASTTAAVFDQSMTVAVKHGIMTGPATAVLAVGRWGRLKARGVEDYTPSLGPRKSEDRGERAGEEEGDGQGSGKEGEAHLGGSVWSVELEVV